MNNIRTGMIGYGYWGPNLVRNLVEIPTSQVIGVSDLRENRLSQIKNIYPQITTCREYPDLFSLDLQAVIIATPPATHYAIARDCLEHGLHVLVEKPLTTSSGEALELCDLARRNNLVLMVGHTFEYNPAVQALKQIIDSGELGRVYYINSIRVNLGLFHPDLNVLWDLAPHDLSILRYLLGAMPQTISAEGMSCVFPGVHDLVYLNMIFPSGVFAHVHVSWLDPCKVRQITVVGSSKMVVYDDVETNEKIKIYDKGVEVPPYTNSYADFQCSYRYGDIRIPNIRFVEPLRQECQHFLDCIANHAQPRTCGQVGLDVVRMLEAAQASLLSGSHQPVPQFSQEIAHLQV